tara:strand:- start:1778 stop:1900 length:123 start_codon:yes stop_codon:yes gene_type:complete
MGQKNEFFNTISPKPPLLKILEKSFRNFEDAGQIQSPQWI